MTKVWIVKKPGSLENLQLVDPADPGAPAAGETRVALHAISLNYHNLLAATGVIPIAGRRILIADGVGVVEAVGAGVNEFQSGDRVVVGFFPQQLDDRPGPLVSGLSQTPGDGAEGLTRQYVVRPANHFTHAPEGWSFREAATIIISGLTTWHVLAVGGWLKVGGTVLTLGIGGVPITALQLARSMGVQAIVTSSLGEKPACARAPGADHLINCRTTPAWGIAMQDITGHHGANLIPELDGPDTPGQSFEVVSVGGHIALIGALAGFEGHVPTHLLMNKQARLQGLVVGNRWQQQDCVNALSLQVSRPIIDKVLDFTALPDAFRYPQDGAYFSEICVEW